MINCLGSNGYDCSYYQLCFEDIRLDEAEKEFSGHFILITTATLFILSLFLSMVYDIENMLEGYFYIV